MYHSFMVRIWREEEWKAEKIQILVESVQSGESYEFDDLDSLQTFLREAVNRGIAPEIDQVRQEGN